ncbi:MAG: carbohydrate ABC transporter permease [Spirochaetales bacterium]|nr:carbohydrate ABC transporter permease [Spirochaetales bacterium]
MIFDIDLGTSSTTKRMVYLAVEVVMIAYAAAVLYPLLNMVLSSFKTTREIFQSPFGMPREWVLDNYRAVWVDGRFGRYIRNSVFVTVVAMAGVLLFGSMASFGIARYRYRLNAAIYMVFLSGIMLPLKAAVIPLFLIVRRMGLLDSHGALILVFAAMGLPSTVFILAGFMRTIPRDLEDAARIDGANDFGIYRRVALPLSAPSIALVTIYNMVPIWNDFFFPLVFIRTDRLKTLPVGISTFFGQYQINWALVFAALSIAMLPMLILYLFMSRYFIKGITAGALK